MQGTEDPAVATEKLQTSVPALVVLTSGACDTFPMIVILFLYDIY